MKIEKEDSGSVKKNEFFQQNTKVNSWGKKENVYSDLLRKLVLDKFSIVTRRRKTVKKVQEKSILQKQDWSFFSSSSPDHSKSRSFSGAQQQQRKHFLPLPYCWGINLLEETLLENVKCKIHYVKSVE